MTSLFFKVLKPLGNECVNGIEVRCVFACPVKVLQDRVELISDIKKAIRPNPRTGTERPQIRWM